MTTDAEKNPGRSISAGRIQGGVSETGVESPPRRRGAWLTAVWITAPCLALAIVILGARGATYEPLAVASAEEGAAAGESTAALARHTPRGLYLVVDSWHNRVRLYRGGEMLREMISSTGSGAVLRHPVTGHTWTFDTPRGERRILRKKTNPVWIKPDWAFIEAGFEPPEQVLHRVDRVSLGDYALDLGDGYLIHGTLFQTLLGQRVTHGCIRLGDDDLAYLYRTVPAGTRVYLY